MKERHFDDFSDYVDALVREDVERSKTIIPPTTAQRGDEQNFRLNESSSSTASPPAPGSSGEKSTRDRIAESLVSDAASKKAGAGSGGQKPRQ